FNDHNTCPFRSLRFEAALASCVYTILISSAASRLCSSTIPLYFKLKSFSLLTHKMFEYSWLPCMVTVAAIALSAILFKEFLKKRA
ncbi:hypothetical protein NL676_012336, partial [Syzygium grande]